MKKLFLVLLIGCFWATNIQAKDELKIRRGAGRARIALIRKLCGVMRRMLLNGEEFHHTKADLFKRKLREYENRLEKIRLEKKIA